MNIQRRWAASEVSYTGTWAAVTPGWSRPANHAIADHQDSGHQVVVARYQESRAAARPISSTARSQNERS